MQPTESLSAHDWVTLVACIGQLALAGLALARVARSPLALAVALLSLGLFSWNFASLAHAVSGAAEWRYLDVALSPLTIPLTLNFMLSFVGRRREHRHSLAAVWLLYGALGGACLAAVVWEPFTVLAGSHAWAAACLVGAASSVAYSLALLRRHHDAAVSEPERVRTRLVVVALAVGGLLAMTELLADLGAPVPRAGNLGTLVAALLLGVVALRFQLLEEALPTRAAALGIALGAFSVAAYLAVFFLFRSQVAIVVFGTVTITVALLGGTYRLFRAHAVERARLRHLASLGRLSGQMAHDLKNPIAALKGAVQFLEAELSPAMASDGQREILALVGEQVDRLSRVVDRYHHLGSTGTARAAVSLNAVVESVVRSQAADSGDGVQIQSVLAPDLPPCAADVELLERALDNLVRNAREASEPGGMVVVATERSCAADGVPAVSIVVQDEGRGLEARAAERAFDDFFTTKRRGSGMGLFFVKRVAEAHGGDATLSSRHERGTEARLWLPAAV